MSNLNNHSRLDVLNCKNNSKLIYLYYVEDVNSISSVLNSGAVICIENKQETEYFESMLNNKYT